MSGHLYYTTREYNWAAGQKLTTSGTSTSSTAIPGNEAMVTATVACWITVGPTAATTAGNKYMAAGETIHLRFPAGSVISAIQDTAAGSVSIIPVL